MPGIRRSLYNAARSSIQVFDVNPDLDPERYYEDNLVAPRLSKRSWIVSHPNHGGAQHPTELGNRGVQLPQNPFDDGYSSISNLSVNENPFHDSHAVAKEPRASPQAPEEESPYHIFSRKQTWFVIAIMVPPGFFQGCRRTSFYRPSTLLHE